LAFIQHASFLIKIQCFLGTIQAARFSHIRKRLAEQSKEYGKNAKRDRCPDKQGFVSYQKTGYEHSYRTYEQ